MFALFFFSLGQRGVSPFYLHLFFFQSGFFLPCLLSKRTLVFLGIGHQNSRGNRCCESDRGSF